MTHSPQLWLLVGGNGAGKSTFYEQFLKPKGIPFVNADVIAKTYFGEQAEARSREAAQIAEHLRFRLVEEKQSFCFETVFSHPSKIDFVAHAKASGYQIVVVFIRLEQHPLHYARVAQRVSLGGHSVPEDKISPRIERLEGNIVSLIEYGLAHHIKILDNSSASDPFKPILTIKGQQLTEHQPATPIWAARFIQAALD